MNELELLAEQAVNGEIDALEAYAKISIAKKKIDELLKSVLDSAIDGFDSYDQKTVTHKGFEIRKTQSARYDFKNVTAWVNTKEELKKIEDYAKVAERNGEALILETGEIVEPAQKHYSSFGLSINKV